jgi:hypothetical protein
MGVFHKNLSLSPLHTTKSHRISWEKNVAHQNEFIKVIALAIGEVDSEGPQGLAWGSVQKFLKPGPLPAPGSSVFPPTPARGLGMELGWGGAAVLPPSPPSLTHAGCVGAAFNALL